MPTTTSKTKTPSRDHVRVICHELTVICAQLTNTVAIWEQAQRELTRELTSEEQEEVSKISAQQDDTIRQAREANPGAVELRAPAMAAATAQSANEHRLAGWRQNQKDATEVIRLAGEKLLLHLEMLFLRLPDQRVHMVIERYKDLTRRTITGGPDMLDNPMAEFRRTGLYSVASTLGPLTHQHAVQIIPLVDELVDCLTSPEPAPKHKPKPKQRNLSHGTVKRPRR